MIRDFLDKLPAWPTVLIAGYFFLKPVMPEPHLWQKIQMFFDGKPMGHIEIIDIALHTFMGLVFFARSGRMIEVWMNREPREENAQDAADESAPGKDADA